MAFWSKKIKRDADGYWLTGISAETIQPNKTTPIEIVGEPILLTRLDDKIIAFSGLCPHAAADLSDSDIHRGRITCHDHGWKFDIRTGRTLWPEDEVCRLKRYPLKQIAGQIAILV